MGTMFSVPALEDGELKFSQTAVIIKYLAEKLSLLPESKTNQVLAEQYLGDLMDLFNEMLKAAYQRQQVFCQLIDRQMKGPYYFGEKPCYVDYALAGVINSMTDLHAETHEAMESPVTEKISGALTSLAKSSQLKVGDEV